MRILFVENDRGFVCDGLKNHFSGDEVRCVPTVAEARSLAPGHEFDVLLVDYHLDDGAGSDVVEHFRASGYTGRIVAISSYELGNRRLVEAGADLVCSKMEFDHIRSFLPT